MNRLTRMINNTISTITIVPTPNPGPMYSRVVAITRNLDFHIFLSNEVVQPYYQWGY